VVSHGARTWVGRYHASQSLLSVGSSPILQHLYRPSEMQARWHSTNTVICGKREWFGERNGANTNVGGLEHTSVYGHDAFEWVHNHHSHDHHAEDLDTIATHPHHHKVHRNGLGGCICCLPSFVYLDLFRRDRAIFHGFGLVLLGRGLWSAPKRTLSSSTPMIASTLSPCLLFLH